MPSFGVAVAWMIISPVAFLTNLVGVVVVLHYKPLFHSCDVAFISIMVTMATNSLLLLPVPAVVNLGDFLWSKNLCIVYTWLSLTLRSSHLLVLLVLNVYWMASLRMSQKGRMFASSKPMKVSVSFCWFTSVITGLIPVSGGAEIFHFYQDQVCTFLPANIGGGFGVFFIIVSLLSAIMGLISTSDTLLVLKSMKNCVQTKYSSRRFSVPTVSAALRTSYHIQPEHRELGVSIELCRLVLCFSVSSAALNALPLMVSQFVQLIQVYDRQAMETTLLWLLLVEATTLPHILWSLSGRYRHAAVYTWKVFVVRDRSIVEDDTSSCMLQAYRLKGKDMSTGHSINGLGSLQVNGTCCGAIGVNNLTNDVADDGNDETSRPQTSGAGQSSSGVTYTTDLDGDVTVMTQLTSSEVVIVHQNLGIYNRNTLNGHVAHSHVLGTPLPTRPGAVTNEMPLASFRVIPAGTETKQSSVTIACKLSQKTLVPSRHAHGHLGRHANGQATFINDRHASQHTPSYTGLQSYFTTSRASTQERDENLLRDRLSVVLNRSSDNENNDAHREMSFQMYHLKGDGGMYETDASKHANREDISTPLTRHMETYNNTGHHYCDYNSNKSFNDKEETYRKECAEIGITNAITVDCAGYNKHYPVVPAHLSGLSHELPQRLSNNHYEQSQTIIPRPRVDRLDSFTVVGRNHNYGRHERILGVYYDDTHTISGDTHTINDDTHTIIRSGYLSSQHLPETHLFISSLTAQTEQMKRPMWSPSVRKRSRRMYRSFSNLVISKVDDDQDGPEVGETVGGENATSGSEQNVPGPEFRLWNPYHPCSELGTNVNQAPTDGSRDTERVKQARTDGSRDTERVKQAPSDGSRDTERVKQAPTDGSRDAERVKQAPTDGSRDAERVKQAPTDGSRDAERVKQARTDGSRDAERVKQAPTDGSRDAERVKQAPTDGSRDAERVKQARTDGSRDTERVKQAPSDGSRDTERVKQAPTDGSRDAERVKQAPTDGSRDAERVKQAPTDGSRDAERVKQARTDGSRDAERVKQAPTDGSRDAERVKQAPTDGSRDAERVKQAPTDGSRDAERVKQAPTDGSRDAERVKQARTDGSRDTERVKQAPSDGSRDTERVKQAPTDGSRDTERVKQAQTDGSRDAERVNQAPTDGSRDTQRSQPSSDVDDTLSLSDVSCSVYRKLEPVEESELLYLKMRSIRAAMAVYCSDDTTSDEFDIDNTRSDNDT